MAFRSPTGLVLGELLAGGSHPDVRTRNRYRSQRILRQRRRRISSAVLVRPSRGQRRSALVRANRAGHARRGDRGGCVPSLALQQDQASDVSPRCLRDRCGPGRQRTAEGRHGSGTSGPPGHVRRGSKLHPRRSCPRPSALRTARSPAATSRLPRCPSPAGFLRGIACERSGWLVGCCSPRPSATHESQWGRIFSATSCSRFSSCG